MSQRIQSIFVFMSLFAGLMQPAGARSIPLPKQSSESSQASTQERAVLLQPVVRYSLKNDVSPDLNEIPLPQLSQTGKTASPRELPVRQVPHQKTVQSNHSVQPKGAQPAGESHPAVADPVLQSIPGSRNMPEPQANFEGLSNEDNLAIISGYVSPPDTIGAVGYDPSSGKKYYVQWVNLVFAIWDVTGVPTQVIGPLSGNSLWSGFGGACEMHNDGDPVVLFDRLSNRWIMSQFAIFEPDGHHQCVAVSTSADPTGSWYRYDFLASSTKINDYPKLGIWPDAFYMAANQFDGASLEWAGQGVWALERDQMLLGQPARSIYHDLYHINPHLAGMLPADLDGAPPPAGTPNYFTLFEDDAWGYGPDQLQLWSFQVNWANPTASSFIHTVDLPAAPFDSEICPMARGQCIDQPNGQVVEDLADRLMYRLQYRNFGGYQTLVVNHSVDVTNAGGQGQAGIRWYELRDDGTGWMIHQQGTYAPDSNHRWMGSVAMDRMGNIALGYSVSSSSVFPSVRYAGRLAGDPPGIFAQAEQELVSSTFSQEGTARWGDYSSMTLDPTDDCTFWYTQQYAAAPNEFSWGNWTTRIGSFKYPTCISGPAGILKGTVTDVLDGTPVSDVAIDLGNGIMTKTDASGFYQFLSLPVGSYDITATLYGYLRQTVTGISIQENQETVQDISLDHAPSTPVSGRVTDASHGWPLYARIDIATFGHSETVFTDPIDGNYSLNLLQDADYTFEVSAVASGYISQSRRVTPPTAGSSINFVLEADQLTCSAPGYEPDYVYQVNFERNDGGYGMEGSGSWQWGIPTSGPDGAHSGQRVWATNLTGDYDSGEDGYLVSPEIDLSAYSGQPIALSWWQFLVTEHYYDFADASVSNDGGRSWTVVFGPTSGFVDEGWNQYQVNLDSSYAVSNFRVRFHLVSDSTIVYPGYYLDDIAIGLTSRRTAPYRQDFEPDDGGFLPSGITSWEWGAPVRGPGRAHWGQNAWATGLMDNYLDNEEGYLTSPDIDLSAYGDKSLILSWWQWLQIEAGYDQAGVQISTNGGLDWTSIFTHTGVLDVEWNQYFYWMNPSQNVDNFRIQFYLHSDSSVTYPGFFIDDIAINTLVDEPDNPPCIAVPGGLVAGNVSDANTGKGLNGAIVRDENDRQTITLATPDDSNVADGFYSLFSPAGLQAYAVKMDDSYGTVSETVTVILSDTVRLDFALPAGMLAASPEELHATLELDQSVTLSVNLFNPGSLPVDFELVARSQGFRPANSIGTPLNLRKGYFSPYHTISPSPALEGIARPIPIHSPPWMDVAQYPSNIMDNTAATWNGLVYSVGGFDGSTSVSFGYKLDPALNVWTPISPLSAARQKPAAVFIDGLLYIVGGWDSNGSVTNELAIYNPEMDSWRAGAPSIAGYAASSAVSLDGKLYVIGGCGSDFCGVPDVYRYDPGLDSWESLAPYPEPVAWQACGAISGLIYCAGGVNEMDELTGTFVYDPIQDDWAERAALPQTQWGMGYTAASGRLYISGGVTNNFSAITNQTFAYDPVEDVWTPDANSNNTLYRSASACGFYKIGGSIGGFSPVSATELYPGLDQCEDEIDVPWLNVSPGSGVIQVGVTQTINVNLDAGLPEIDEPGQYRAELVIKHDTPYTIDPIPVSLNVTPPKTWGKLTGQVVGLSRCEGEGAPLPNATIEIAGWKTVRPDQQGTYSVWAEAGDYRVTVSSAGHLSQTTELQITGGITRTVDFNLRLDAPCAAASPPAFQVGLDENETVTVNLSLRNLGTQSFTYEVKETLFDLTPAIPAASRTAGQAFHLAGKSGPASVLSLAAPHRPGQEGPFTPESGWYGGLDFNGRVRYGAAQCADAPNHFYVISGIDPTFSLTSEVQRYSAVDNTWETLAPIPVASEAPVAVCYMERVYVMGGSGTDRFYIYDIATNRWSTGAALPRGVAGAAVGAWAGKIYLIGGDDDFYPASGVSSAVNIYDIASNAWVGLGASLLLDTSFAGFVQVGPYVYVVGGWGSGAPYENISSTQRYNMLTDQWERGPDLTSSRADFALAATDQAIYAIAGDQTDGSFFDASPLVERLDLSAWPAGQWIDTGDPLPKAVSSNSAGFCTGIFSGSAIWSTGGGNVLESSIYDFNLFHPLDNENCFSVYSDVGWIIESPPAGRVLGESEEQIQLTFNSTGLPTGMYQATLVILTSDPGAPVMMVPVRLLVGLGHKIFFPTMVR